jgi:predicted dehydrogenase
VHHYKREVASYLSKVAADSRPYGPTLDDGVACLEVIEAGYESAGKGGIGVPITH